MRRNQPRSKVALDPHGDIAMRSLSGMVDGIVRFADSEDPESEVQASLDEVVVEATKLLTGIDPATAIELIRVACLPWSTSGSVDPESQSGPTRSELLALIVIAANSGAGPISDLSDIPQVGTAAAPLDPAIKPLAFGHTSRSINDALPLVDQIFQLGELLELSRADMTDQLGFISAILRGSEIWIRNTSYPDIVAATLREMFGPEAIAAQLRSDLGFAVGDALDVLFGLHKLQIDRLNTRMRSMGAVILQSREAAAGGPTDDALLEAARAAVHAAMEPSAEAVAFTAAEVAEAAKVTVDVAKAVLGFFTLDLGGQSTSEVVREFTEGRNPMRAKPVVRTAVKPEPRFMLVHDAQCTIAVREQLEEHLKSTGVWETYQTHRGVLLESRTAELLGRVLSTAQTWHGFDYYIPASNAEAAGNHMAYTKRVEGDHLYVQDDLAVIVEDKAVAMSPVARSGQSARIRRDLTGIIKKAADQAARLQDRIEQDRGVRLHDDGWLDLSHIREIHTIAVSLDDLMGASTATAELVKVGLLHADRIPWTVSTHDLDLITRLVDRPAEFLLYLRRRCDPEATVFYTAPDELDLFLYFFETGLYVEPDPDQIRKALPWMPPVTTGERRRRRNQVAQYITSRTDALDAWHYSELNAGRPDVTEGDEDVAKSSSERSGGAAAESQPASGGGVRGESGETRTTTASAPKPGMVASPLAGFVDVLQERGDYAWLTIGATLLSGSSAAQDKLARIPMELLNNPFGDGRQRSHTVPFASSVEDGWVLVWVTRPPERIPQEFEQDSRDYLRLKMHQLGLPRGVVFCFDEVTFELVGVWFDDHVGDLDPALATRAGGLRAPEDMTSWQPPQAKVRAGTKTRSKATKRRKRAR